ncbi:hypothetical protein [Maribacter sp. ACAM166]|uniref:hypothetical protein n=1 Tax=Maribacter sp. ACAM166 TaxID=2508996 RepID=UPI001BB1A2D6|nr:hypothetical protein [Maribacter sp. ACAM166]
MFSFISLRCKENHKQKNNQVNKEQQEATGTENLAYKWGEMALKATANDTERFKPRPTITSRYLGLIFVSVFDAWSRYDERANLVYHKGVDRRQKRVFPK